jgi:protein-tyrosine-phosphatase
MAGGNILFLCTGNSARSILAEALLNRLGGGHWQGFSAGSFPRGAVHPAALHVLSERGFPTAGLRSKSWDEFADPAGPRIDHVVTVCDNAAGETCPIWPGNPARTHWSLADPAAVEGGDQRAAFEETYRQLETRIRDFLARQQNG